MSQHRRRSLHWGVGFGLAPSVLASSTTMAAGARVFTQTNSAAGDAVIGFERSADGSLTAAGSVATGGLGLGAGLASRGAIAVCDGGGHVVAAGLDADGVAARSPRPNDLAFSSIGRCLFVINPGAGAVTSYRTRVDGSLTAIGTDTVPVGSVGIAAR